jgi:hypothetical protein
MAKPERSSFRITVFSFARTMVNQAAIAVNQGSTCISWTRKLIVFWTTEAGRQNEANFSQSVSGRQRLASRPPEVLRRSCPLDIPLELRQTAFIV